MGFTSITTASAADGEGVDNWLNLHSEAVIHIFQLADPLFFHIQLLGEGTVLIYLGNNYWSLTIDQLSDFCDWLFSQNPDAIFEYLCRYLGVLFANGVTRSVRMATLTEGSTRRVRGRRNLALEPPPPRR